MAYNVTAIDTEGNSTTFECEEDEYILDKLEEEGIDAPFLVRQVRVQRVQQRL